VLYGVLPYGSMYLSDELDIRFWTRGKFNCIVIESFHYWFIILAL